MVIHHARRSRQPAMILGRLACLALLLFLVLFFLMMEFLMLRTMTLPEPKHKEPLVTPIRTTTGTPKNTTSRKRKEPVVTPISTTSTPKNNTRSRPERSGLTPPRRLEFVHIPKSGGTALEVAAARVNVSWGLCHFRNRIEANRGENWVGCPPQGREPVDWSVGLPLPISIRRSMFAQWHVPSYYYDAVDFLEPTEEGEEPVLPSPYKGAALFAVVRDPCDRIISEYFMQEEEYALRLGGKVNVTELNDASRMNQWIQDRLGLFLQNATAGVDIVTDKGSIRKSIWPSASFYSLDGHLIPQSHFIFDTNGNQVIDCIIYFDYLDAQFPSLMKQFRLEAIELPEDTGLIRKSKNKHLSQTDLTPQTQELIRTVYAEDFKLIKSLNMPTQNGKAYRGHPSTFPVCDSLDFPDQERKKTHGLLRELSA